MNNLAVKMESNVRSLRPSDLEQVIAIDSDYVGVPRRHFFERRLAHAEKNPEDFVQIGVARNGALVGFVFVRILRGEFGREQAVARLDALGVMSSSRQSGVGRALMDGLTESMRRKKIQSLQSQADWTDDVLLRFFNACGFGLAPRLMLERSVLTPLAESVEGE
jgi:ribosomal protein S18 acetylase RimI-like enzyme